jgi:hypothetical protein
MKVLSAVTAAIVALAAASKGAHEQQWQGISQAGAGEKERVDSSNMIVLASYLGDLHGPFLAGP